MCGPVLDVIFSQYKMSTKSMLLQELRSEINLEIKLRDHRLFY